MDVLGNVNKRNTFNLEKSFDARDDIKSVRSKYSEISRNQAQTVLKDGTKAMEPIDEYEEIRLVNSKGETIELNKDQLLYLAKLCRDKAEETENATEERDNRPSQREINYDMLK